MSKLLSNNRIKPNVILLAKNDCPLNCKGNHCDECQFDFEQLSPNEQQVLFTEGIQVFLGVKQINIK